MSTCGLGQHAPVSPNPWPGRALAQCCPDVDAAPDQLSEAERRRGQRAALRANAFTQSVPDIVTGNLMQLFAVDVLGLGGGAVGVLRGVPPLAALLRVLVLPLTRRLGLVGTLRWTGILRLIVVLVLAVLPIAWLSFPVYLGLLVAFSLAWSLGPRVAWQPLMRQISTTEDRGTFFSNMRFVFSVTGAATSLLIAALVGDVLDAGTYRILLLIAAVMLVTHIVSVAGIPERRLSPRRRTANSGLFAVLRRSPLLRRPLAIDVLLLLANMPLLLVYLRQLLHLPTNLVAIYLVVVGVGTTLSFLLWGRVADALGFKPVLIGLLGINLLASPIILAVAPFPTDLAWATLSAESLRSLGALGAHALLMGSTMAGIGIATISVQHFFVSSDDALEAMTWHATVTILVEAGVAVLCGWLIAGPALDWGSRAFADGLIHIDLVKVWMVGLGGACKVAALVIALGMPNARPEFGVGDFFSSIAANPVRTLVATRARHDEEEAERARLARWLGDHLSPMGIRPLLDLLEDPSSDVRVEAVRSLARVQSPLAGERLTALLTDEGHMQIADQVAWALGELKHAAAVPALLRLLAVGEGERLRANAARALGKIGDVCAIAPIAARLREADESVHVRAACARALLRLQARDHIALVVDQIPLLSGRIERHELYDVLCDWMGITNRWLLRSKPSVPLRDSLLSFVGDRPAAWQREHAAVLKALAERDAEVLRREADRVCATAPPDPVVAALRDLANRQREWGAQMTLLGAWIVLR